MSKRAADKYLSPENCEDEDEAEDPGFFEKANEDSIKGRVIRKAKRTLLNDSGAKPSPFSSFSGFGAKKSPFHSTNISVLNSNGTSTSDTSKPKLAENNTNSKDTEFYQNIQQLNQSFVDWVTEYHSENNYYNFTQVCKEYQIHFQELEDNYSPNKKNVETTSVKFPDINKTPFPQLEHTTKFSFATNNAINAAKPTTQSSLFQFGASSSTTPNVTPSLFSFGVANALAKQKENPADDDDNYEPPKSEFKPVEESDSLYSKRCKLFYKKNDDYVEKGVGILHLKKTEEKTQLLIRADTALGNILLNIHLKDQLPMQRLGKNNILIVCVPHPPLESKESKEPVSMLIRVKTSEEADELLEKLNEFKC